MTDLSLPEITIGEALSRAIRSIAGEYPSIEAAEAAALRQKVSESLDLNQEWSSFRDLVRLSIRDHGYIVVRGLEPDEGVSLLVVSIAFGAEFETYGQGRIVKRFRMSPWTSELSHTARAGDFHTDGNVSERPPIGTAIQCEREDPGAPEYGVQRVVHLPRLLTQLKTGSKADMDAFSFLTESVAVMAHERSSRLWQGILVAGNSIRYHPHKSSNSRPATRWCGFPARRDHLQYSPSGSQRICSLSYSPWRHGTCFEPDGPSLSRCLLCLFHPIPDRV